MNFPLVSIIIPFYNSEYYLAETIKSAIAQDWLFKEIILIDDGSTDNSFTIAKSYENEWIKVFRQENKGASSARNYGLRVAVGEYIQFLDSDDLLSPNKISAQISILNYSKQQIALCPTVNFYSDENPFEKQITHDWIQKGSDDTVDFLIKLYGGPLVGPNYGGMIQPNAWLTSRKIINKTGYWNEELSVDDDGEFFCRVVLNAKGIRYSPTSINYYRKYLIGTNLSAGKLFKHHLSALNSTILKAKVLLVHTKSEMANLAISRCFWENAFSSYPDYKHLSLRAEKLAKEYGNDSIFEPYPKGIKRILCQIFGWKLVKSLQQIKSKFF